MKKAQWEPEWLQDKVIHLVEPGVWRGVETQYASSSLQLVDSHAEHDAHLRHCCRRGFDIRSVLIAL